MEQAEKIAFCCIFTGVFMFPNKRVAESSTSSKKKVLKRFILKAPIWPLNYTGPLDLKI